MHPCGAWCSPCGATPRRIVHCGEILLDALRVRARPMCGVHAPVRCQTTHQGRKGSSHHRGDVLCRFEALAPVLQPNEVRGGRNASSTSSHVHDDDGPRGDRRLWPRGPAQRGISAPSGESCAAGDDDGRGCICARSEGRDPVGDRFRSRWIVEATS